MFDPFLQAVAQALAALYELPVVGGSFGVAIILLTLVVMILLMPLTLKATRSTIKMTQVQPELKRLQKKYKDDRETLNQEMMKLYQEHGINPVGGCLPMLAQLPVFLVLFQVLRGLSRRISDQPFFEAANLVREQSGLSVSAGNEISPRFLGPDTEMYHQLAGQTKMSFGPFDLAAEAGEVLSDSILRGIPYLLMVVVVVGASYYQQRQVSARRTEGAPSMNPQQQMLLRFLPLLSGFWSFFFPAGLVLYWATSNTFRIGQQAYITHQIYGKEMADGGKLSAPPKKPDDAKKRSGGDDSDAKGTSSKNANAKKKDSEADSTQSSGSGRNAEWEKRRAAKAQVKKSSSAQSDRVTPKGTKPQDPRAKNKKNRKR